LEAQESEEYSLIPIFIEVESIKSTKSRAFRYFNMKLNAAYYLSPIHFHLILGIYHLHEQSLLLFHYILSYAPLKCNFNMKLNVAYNLKSTCSIHLMLGIQLNLP
jgi:hypothetical protein